MFGKEGLKKVSKRLESSCSCVFAICGPGKRTKVIDWENQARNSGHGIEV